jgi:hypothetical protein
MNKSKLVKIRTELDAYLKANQPWAERYYKHGEHFKTLLTESANLERAFRTYFKKTEKRILSKIDWDKYEKNLNG